MDVHDRVGEGIYEQWRDDPHETRKRNQLDSIFAERGNQRFIVSFAAGKEAMVQVQGGDIVHSRPLQGKCCGIVAYHAGNLGGERAVCAPVDQGLQV
jgi:hypothetical protein